MKEPNTGPRMLAATLLVLALLLGTATGVALDRFVLRPDVAMSEQAPRPAGEGERRRGSSSRERYHAQLTRELGLSAAQQAHVDSVVSRQEERLRALNHEVRPQFDSIFAATRAAIDAVLTPEQRARMSELRAEWKQRKHREKAPAAPSGS